MELLNIIIIVLLIISLFKKKKNLLNELELEVYKILTADNSTLTLDAFKNIRIKFEKFWNQYHSKKIEELNDKILEKKKEFINHIGYECDISKEGLELSTSKYYFIKNYMLGYLLIFLSLIIAYYNLTFLNLNSPIFNLVKSGRNFLYTFILYSMFITSQIIQYFGKRISGFNRKTGTQQAIIISFNIFYFAIILIFPLIYNLLY